MDCPYASVRPIPSTVSPAQVNLARPLRPRFTPLPQSTGHDAGFGGGRQCRSRMSQRTPERAIAHPMLPVGDWKNAGAAVAVVGNRSTKRVLNSTPRIRGTIPRRHFARSRKDSGQQRTAVWAGVSWRSRAQALRLEPRRWAHERRRAPRAAVRRAACHPLSPGGPLSSAPQRSAEARVAAARRARPATRSRAHDRSLPRSADAPRSTGRTRTAARPGDEPCGSSRLSRTPRAGLRPLSIRPRS
jgi:hypothetical protein